MQNKQHEEYWANKEKRAAEKRQKQKELEENRAARKVRTFAIAGAAVLLILLHFEKHEQSAEGKLHSLLLYA